jgi:hypothetical protein
VRKNLYSEIHYPITEILTLVKNLICANFVIEAFQVLATIGQMSVHLGIKRKKQKVSKKLISTDNVLITKIKKKCENQYNK